MGCKVKDCKNTELVYSGVDAFVLGIPTESYCYDCANTYAQIKNHIDEDKVAVK